MLVLLVAMMTRWGGISQRHLKIQYSCSHVMDSVTLTAWMFSMLGMQSMWGIYMEYYITMEHSCNNHRILDEN